VTPSVIDRVTLTLVTPLYKCATYLLIYLLTHSNDSSSSNTNKIAFVGDRPPMNVFLVTWQRMWSHHSIRCSRKPYAVRPLYGSLFYRTGVIFN